MVEGSDVADKGREVGPASAKRSRRCLACMSFGWVSGFEMVIVTVASKDLIVFSRFCYLLFRGLPTLHFRLFCFDWSMAFKASDGSVGLFECVFV